MIPEDQIKNITEDRSHGSSVLLKKIEDLFSARGFSDEEVREILERLEDVHPSMALVRHFITTIQDKQSELSLEIESYFSKWNDLDSEILKVFLEHTDPEGKRIMSHSHSGMVLRLLTSLNKERYSFKVIQTLSAPGGEGRTSVEDLEKAGIWVKLINDEEISDFSEKCDLAILGVDQFDDFYFVNKLKSSVIIDHLAHKSKPVFVLSDPRKKVSRLNYLHDIFEKIPLEKVTWISPGF